MCPTPALYACPPADLLTGINQSDEHARRNRAASSDVHSLRPLRVRDQGGPARGLRVRTGTDLVTGLPTPRHDEVDGRPRPACRSAEPCTGESRPGRGQCACYVIRAPMPWSKERVHDPSAGRGKGVVRTKHYPSDISREPFEHVRPLSEQGAAQDQAPYGRSVRGVLRRAVPAAHRSQESPQSEPAVKAIPAPGAFPAGG